MKTIVTEMQETSKQAVANLRKQISSYDNVLLGAGYVVLQHGMAVNCVIENNRLMGASLHNIQDAQMWDKATAKQLANATRDGAGVKNKAMHIKSALKMLLKQQLEHLDTCVGLVAAVDAV